MSVIYGPVSGTIPTLLVGKRGTDQATVFLEDFPRPRSLRPGTMPRSPDDVAQIHFYTLNRADATRAIFNSLSACDAPTNFKIPTRRKRHVRSRFLDHLTVRPRNIDLTVPRILATNALLP